MTVLKIETASRTVAAGATGEDQAGVFLKGDVVLLVVADGAGGQAGGGAAWLREIDRVIELDPNLGETTATLCAIEDGQFVGGVSVGDSEAMLITNADVTHLTSGQRRKPLLGSGQAIPHPFFTRRATGTILLATDGLFKYASRPKIASIVRQTVFVEIADRLVTAVRLPSGDLQDDVGLAIYRT